MKRLFSGLLTVALLTSTLAGCASGSSAGSSSQADSAQAGSQSASQSNSAGGTVTVMGNARMYEGEEDAWNQVIADFKAETGIQVDLRWQGKWDEVPQNLTAAKMANEKVDLVTVGAGLINSSVASSGMLMNITDLMEPHRDRFNDGMLDSYTIGGKLWGFPYGNSAAGFIYYNKTLFQELGIEEAKTFDELVKISQTIQEKKGIIPMIYRGKDASYWPGWFFSTFAQVTDNNSIATLQDILSGKRTFEEQDVTTALDKVKAFFDTGIVTKESLDTNGDGMKALFFQGQAAMLLTHNFQILPDQCEFELDLMEFPLVVDDGKAYSQPSGGPGTGIAVPSFADRGNLDNTMKFVEYLLRAENANKIIACYKPVVDVIKGVEVLDKPIVKRLNDELIPKTITYLDWIWPAEVQDAFTQVIPAMVNNNMDSAQAAKTIQEALDGAVQERGYKFEWWNDWTQEDWDKVTP